MLTGECLGALVRDGAWPPKDFAALAAAVSALDSGPKSYWHSALPRARARVVWFAGGRVAPADFMSICAGLQKAFAALSEADRGQLPADLVAKLCA